jgi:hypothetical protein
MYPNGSPPGDVPDGSITVAYERFRWGGCCQVRGRPGSRDRAGVVSGGAWGQAPPLLVIYRIVA